LTRDVVEQRNSALFSHLLKAMTARAHFLSQRARSTTAAAATSSSTTVSPSGSLTSTTTSMFQQPTTMPPSTSPLSTSYGSFSSMVRISRDDLARPSPPSASSSARHQHSPHQHHQQQQQPPMLQPSSAASSTRRSVGIDVAPPMIDADARHNSLELDAADTDESALRRMFRGMSFSNSPNTLSASRFWC
jgi:hypothetical protein